VPFCIVEFRKEHLQTLAAMYQREAVMNLKEEQFERDLVRDEEVQNKEEDS
jgi:hypothetical protein